MAFPESASRHSLIPSYLYSTSLPKQSTSLEAMLSSTPFSGGSSADLNTVRASRGKSFVIPAPSEPAKIEMYSPAFYAACTFGGILSCGLTHMAVTPLDLVKCNMQVSDPLDLLFSDKVCLILSVALDLAMTGSMD